MASKCDQCGETFKSEHGVSVHKVRSPCGGKKWSGAKKSTRYKKKSVVSNGETGKDAIHRLLSENPQGMAVCNITDELRANGFQFADNYVASVASKDKDLIRLERGSYRLKKTKLRQSSQTDQNDATPFADGRQRALAVAKNVVPEVNNAEIPREALLVRIDSLEAQNKGLEKKNRALEDAHISYIRGT